MKSFHTHGNVASLYSKLTNHQMVCAEVQNPRICRPTQSWSCCMCLSISKCFKKDLKIRGTPALDDSMI